VLDRQHEVQVQVVTKRILFEKLLGDRTWVKKLINRTQWLASSNGRPLRLSVRKDLHAQCQTYQGRSYWVVKDPLNLKYYRFEEEEYALLQMLDGKTSPDRIKREFEYQFSPQKISIGELFQFAGIKKLGRESGGSR